MRWIKRSPKLFGLIKKRKLTTTVAGPKTQAFPDLVGRYFTAEAPNQIHSGDIMYLPIADESNMYLATVANDPPADLLHDR